MSSFIHFVLLLTQLVQLWLAMRIRRAQTLKCPHCSHTMQQIGTATSTFAATDDVQPSPQVSVLLSQESLVDTADDGTVIGMAPDQETGTTTRTPRMASSADLRLQRARSGSCTANEHGENEGDRLIEKSE